jgi:hypothetical protein
MTPLSDASSLLDLIAMLVVVIGTFVKNSIRLRQGGGSLPTNVLGTTEDFLTEECTIASQAIVNANAGK